MYLQLNIEIQGISIDSYKVKGILFTTTGVHSARRSSSTSRPLGPSFGMHGSDGGELGGGCWLFVGAEPRFQVRRA